MNVYYIPNGPTNLTDRFPAIIWDNVAEYYVEVLDYFDETIGTGTLNQLTVGNCCTDKARIHFVNYLGSIDAINFNLYEKIHEAKSDSMRRSIPYPFVRKEHGAGRLNVRANDILTLSNIDYREEDQDWIAELVDSPLAWMEWVSSQGDPSDYIPVVIVDGKFSKKKLEDRYVYELLINVLPSHEKFILR